MTNFKKRIIVIEDSQVEQNIIYNALKNIYSTSVAYSGNTGIKLINNSIPDLIILDLLMDDGNGWDTISQLKLNPVTKNIPIIVTTSCMDEEIVCFKLGASDFISKPVVPEILKERIKIHLSLQEKITIDSLTGAYNRNKLIEISSREIFKCSTFYDPLSILYLDIDKFKNINDELGHDIGDYVLKNIIESIQLNTRRSDYIVRMGGDEFIIIFIKTSGKKALQITSRIQNIINNKKIEYDGDSILDVTVSLGLTEYRAGDTFDVMIKRVDELLYKSKRMGKGQLTYDI